VAPDHRRRTVAHAVKLIQPRRLEQAGHQKEVAARLDEVRQRFVEAERQGPFLPGKLAAQLLESAVVNRVALAQHDQLRSLFEQRGSNFGDQIDAFLLGQTGDDAREGRVGRFGETLAALQLGLAGRFAGREGVGAVVGGK